MNLKPAFYQGVTTRTTEGDRPFQEELLQEPSKDTKAKLVISQPADHRWADIAQENPEVQLAAESLGARTLQERYHGTRTRAPHQKGAQTGLWIHRLAGWC